MDREGERQRWIKCTTSSGLLPGAEVERKFCSATPPWTTFTHKYTRTPVWTALPHVDERQLLFQGALTPLPNQERERQSPNKVSGGAFIYLPCPAFSSHELKASLCPAPPSWRAFSFPAADEKAWHAFLPFPASLLLEGEGGASGCLERLGRCCRATLYSPLPYKRRDSRATSHLRCGMPRLGSQEMKRSSVFEGQPLSALLFGSAVARSFFEVWEVKITGMALCHSIGPFTS